MEAKVPLPRFCQKMSMLRAVYGSEGQSPAGLAIQNTPQWREAASGPLHNGGLKERWTPASIRASGRKRAHGATAGHSVSHLRRPETEPLDELANRNDGNAAERSETQKMGVPGHSKQPGPKDPALGGPLEGGFRSAR